jgi:hypothetical protein
MEPMHWRVWVLQVVTQAVGASWLPQNVPIVYPDLRLSPPTSPTVLSARIPPHTTLWGRGFPKLLSILQGARVDASLFRAVPSNAKG